jgi:hypothetical protein
MSSTENSLVMGTISGLSLEQTLPFLRSLRATSYRGRACLFLDRMTPSAIEGIKSIADEVVVLDAVYEKPGGISQALISSLKKIRKTRGLRRLYKNAFRFALACMGNSEANWKRMEYQLEGLQSLRYLHYLEFLEGAASADLIMISDVRDVVFQSDPFERASASELRVFLEPEHVRLGENAFNSRWLRNLYGAQVISEIGDGVVSCSGTTIGTRSGMMRYLTKMVAEIRSKRMALGSHDQGIHNYLVRQGALDPVEIVKNDAGEVFTMGEVKSFALNERDHVINAAREAPAVLHQYDRHVDLARRIWGNLDEMAAPSKFKASI